MAQAIYIILQYPTSRDDYRVIPEDDYLSIVEVWGDYDKAKNAIVEYKAFDALLEKEYEKYREFQKAWEEKNPRPELHSYVFYPRWPAGLKQQEITVEMRQERDAFIQKNKEIGELNDQLTKAWQAKENIAKAEYLSQLDSKLAEVLATVTYDSFEYRTAYRIKEMEVKL